MNRISNIRGPRIVTNTVERKIITFFVCRMNFIHCMYYTRCFTSQFLIVFFFFLSCLYTVLCLWTTGVIAKERPIGSKCNFMYEKSIYTLPLFEYFGSLAHSLFLYLFLRSHTDTLNTQLYTSPFTVYSIQFSSVQFSWNLQPKTRLTVKRRRKQQQQ